MLGNSEEIEYMPTIPLRIKYINKNIGELKMSEIKKEFTVKETKELFGFAISLVNTLVTVLKDGKIGWTEYFSFISPLSKLPGAIDGITEIPLELKDLSEEERNELIQYVKDTLETDNEKAEKIATAALKFVLGFSEVYQAIKE